jgi:hypothetical protein
MVARNPISHLLQPKKAKLSTRFLTTGRYSLFGQQTFVVPLGKGIEKKKQFALVYA